MQGRQEHDKSTFGPAVAAFSSPVQAKAVMGTGGQAVPTEHAGRAGLPALVKAVQRSVTADTGAGAALHAGRHPAYAPGGESA